ncbi:MAG: hypothetical protein ACREOG_18860, partial [Gemmatimonadaceae bacterium]
VTVNDTVEKKTVVLGPVRVTFGREPRMQVCPICRSPGDMRLTDTVGSVIARADRVAAGTS